MGGCASYRVPCENGKAPGQRNFSYSDSSTLRANQIFFLFALEALLAQEMNR